MPGVYKQLLTIKDTLERHYKEMQDLEFTVQDGELFMLQTRTGKRTAQAAVRIAVEMAQEGLIDEKEALRRVDPVQLDRLLHPTFDPAAERVLLSRGGLPASPGAVSGRVVFTAEDAESWASRGEKVVLVRRETSPEDIHGMHAAQGILTATGGMTSHAAVVARGMGRPCVAGCSALTIDEGAGSAGEVFDEQAAGIDREAGMAAGDGEVLDEDRGAFTAADNSRREVEAVLLEQACPRENL